MDRRTWLATSCRSAGRVLRVDASAQKSQKPDRLRLSSSVSPSSDVVS